MSTKSVATDTSFQTSSDYSSVLQSSGVLVDEITAEDVSTVRRGRLVLGDSDSCNQVVCAWMHFISLVINSLISFLLPPSPLSIKLKLLLCILVIKRR